MPSDITGTVTHSHDPKPPELPPLPEAILLRASPGFDGWDIVTVDDREAVASDAKVEEACGFATRIVTIQSPPSAREVTDACCGTGLCDPAAEIAQLRLDCKALAAEVRLRRATPESSPGEIWEAMEAVDASGALTRHKEATP